MTPLPESGQVVKDVDRNPYFGFSYALPTDWSENYSGPPPSDSGTYVLALVGPSAKFQGPSRATLLVQAHDLFFSLASAHSAMELAQYAKDTLEPFYEVERSPLEVKIADRSFVRFDYKSEAAGLHWIVLTTDIRCHAVQFIFSVQAVRAERPARRGGDGAPLRVLTPLAEAREGSLRDIHGRMTLARQLAVRSGLRPMLR